MAERFSINEINEYLYTLDGSGECGDCKYEIARFVDAKSYAAGIEEGIEISIQAGREIAAREASQLIDRLFECLSHADFSNGVEAFGMDEGRELSSKFITEIEQDYSAFKSAYGVNK
jgi:hypothetical protein